MKENGKRLDWIINEPALVFSLEESVFIGSLRSASWLTSVIIVPLVARTRLKKRKDLSLSMEKKHSSSSFPIFFLFFRGNSKFEFYLSIGKRRLIKFE